jgi:hypothetical protein
LDYFYSWIDTKQNNGSSRSDVHLIVEGRKLNGNEIVWLTFIAIIKKVE